jgi:hypothetical protein
MQAQRSNWRRAPKRDVAPAKLEPRKTEERENCDANCASALVNEIWVFLRKIVAYTVGELETS